MKTISSLLLTAALIGFSVTKPVAQVAINNTATNPDASAILDLNSGNTGVNKGFLAPQVALTDITVSAPVTNPAPGLIVYNTNIAGSPPNNVVQGYYYWSGSTWMLTLAPSVGNIGQVLTSNGGGAPSWTTPAPSEWTYLEKVTYSNSYTQQDFSGLTTHDKWKLVFSVTNNNTAEQMKIAIRLNSIPSANYNWESIGNSGFNGNPGDTAIFVMLQNTAALGYRVLIGEVFINGKHYQGIKTVAGNDLSAGNNSDYVMFYGALSNDPNNLTTINICPLNHITGTIELWFKDNQ